MDNIRILAIEDDPINARKIKFMIEELGYTLIDVIDNGEEAIKTFKKSQPDVVLMDIIIKGGRDGIEVAHEMNKIRATPVIFLTSMKDDESFQRAKQTHTYGFINKPFEQQTLQRSIELAIQNFSNISQEGTWTKDVLVSDSFFVKVGNKLIKIPISSIKWIEVKDDYCSVVVENKRYNVKISLKEFSAKLPSADFVRVHRNYIVNANEISNIDTNQYYLTIDTNEIPITRTYKDALLKRLNML